MPERPTMKMDVLIAGAGPVGLTMASELARYGLVVRLIDKNTERTDKSKALVLWARTLELIDRMGTGCAQRFIEAGCAYFVLDAICDAADEARQIEIFAADLFPKFQGR